MNNNGYIKLHRKFFAHELWTEARTFSSCEAWLDIIQSARMDATPHTESIGGRDITWSRGQYPASVRFLAKRWGWSTRTVRTFLNKLTRRGMITVDCQSQGMNIITLRREYEFLTTETPIDTGKDHKISQLKDLVTQLAAQQVHSGETNYRYKRNKYNNSPLPPQENESERDLDFIEYSKLKNALLNDAVWKENICRQSGQGAWFVKELPEQIDYFLSWIHSMGEEDSIREFKDAKRRFFYWWKYHGKKDFENATENQQRYIVY